MEEVASHMDIAYGELGEIEYKIIGFEKGLDMLPALWKDGDGIHIAFVHSPDGVFGVGQEIWVYSETTGEYQKMAEGLSGIDALAVAGHKGMMGIQGSGALIMSARCHPRPLMFGGTGSASYDLDMPGFYPDRLEAGTLSYPAIVSLGEGVLWLSTRLYENRDYLVYLTDKLLHGLEELPFVTLYSRTNPFGIVAFDVRGMPSEEVAERLSREHGICVRGGLHCAPLMHGALGTSGLVRASLSPFNTAGEVEYFLKAVRGLHACA